MAELPKFEGALMTELKSQFYRLKTKKTVALAYGFIFLFIAFTIFLAFSPSPNPSSPWFSNIFSVSINGRANDAAETATPTAASSDGPYGSQISSIYSYFFPDSSQQRTIPVSELSSPPPTDIGRSQNNTTPEAEYYGTGSPIEYNQSYAELPTDKVENLKQNQSSVGAPAPNTSSEPVPSSSGEGEKRVEEKGVAKNLTSSLVGKQSNGTGVSWKQEWVKSVENCNLFDGRWVKDESYPLYKPGSCSLIDEQFNCFLNGRPDTNFHKLRWKPNGCHIPRLDGSHMLELLRGKRLVFVGDSLNRNMWESLICILRNSAKNQKKVYEASGRHHFRSEASYSFIFEDYDFTVEFYMSPFLVREVEYKGKDGAKKETLRLDLVGETAEKYKNADIIIFNTGHWWTHDKTSLGKDYYQEGSHVYSELNVLEAFRRAITTWARWVDSNINPSRSQVFFRGYSSSHFSGGQWNSGGQCDHETEPIKNETYLSQYPSKMTVLEKILKNMKTPVHYLNVTRMTDYRKDGHPSIYRKQQMTEEERKSPLRFQDCSHWCLPGVPDSWNEILYAQMLVKHYQKQEENKKKS